MRSEGKEEQLEILGEYAMVKEFGTGFYDLDEITTQQFALIYSIDNLNQERINPKR